MKWERHHIKEKVNKLRRAIRYGEYDRTIAISLLVLLAYITVTVTTILIGSK